MYRPIINHFRRANIMREQIAALATQFTGLELAEKIKELGPYKSRGHGGKYRPQRAFKVMHGSRSRYSPHQGAQEIARRKRQIEQGILAI